MDAFKTLKDGALADGADETDDTPSLLVVILDANPVSWYSLAQKAPISEILADIIVFINAHLAFHHENRVAVIASHTDSVEFLYPTTKDNRKTKQVDPEKDANTYRKFREVDDMVLEGMARLVESTNSISTKTMMSGALSRALAYINRIQTESPLRSRILIFSLSGDVALQYISTMNCIFCAQKKNIPINVCSLSKETLFLEQAVDATGGIYIKVEEPKGLLQHLMMSLFPDQNLRKHINIPNQANVDFRATCFCHKKILDIGYVCSVCLSIFCSPRDQCTTCHSTFKVNKMRRLN
ncbi:transcription factor TFIIH complex subunit Tfb4 [Schizosaccharomyces japonicus yFS275]|uniref:General transcription and DNA repair factor IIH subunit TFB4 n=1 Tax=Schizosaccharomyces japonicus (strain yFS275 / FY16936) TaxID=402676 RepID=B6K6N1_SCHJY|nr:transcription factor TFIIH complex subunit Tfb4 [Schizosaccharomyces japonicus yFS275]EEB09185.1 transcription factor TFIIH complex subunit Tfb4 [Schizosaccharomyces japonicus yFS275]